ncbi:MAG: hypothetical protein AAB011_10685 [Candidatus Eisenbacteria bacterium]
MPKKKASQVGGQVQRLLNPGQVPSFYTNHCEVAVVAGDVRIAFREVVDASETEIVLKEIFRVYMNVEVGGRLAKILTDSVTAAIKDKPKSGAKGG